MSNKTPTLREIERRQTYISIGRFVAYGVLIGDALFSYWALKASSQNNLFSIVLATGIAASQWAVSASIYNKSAARFLKLDRNGDGKLEPAEILRAVIVWGSIVMVYWVDLATNLTGIDMLSVGAMLRVPLLSQIWPQAGGWLLSAVFMFMDETIHYFLDPLQQDIDEQRVDAAKLAAEQNYHATANATYRKTLALGAPEQGKNQAQQYMSRSGNGDGMRKVRDKQHGADTPWNS